MNDKIDILIKALEARIERAHYLVAYHDKKWSAAINLEEMIKADNLRTYFRGVEEGYRHAIDMIQSPADKLKSELDAHKEVMK